MTALDSVSANTHLQRSAEDLLENLAHPVLLVGEDGKVEYANIAGQACLGGWILGLCFQDLFPDHLETLSISTLAREPFVLVSRTHIRFRALIGSVTRGAVLLSLFPDTSQAPALSSEGDELTGLLKRRDMNDRLDQVLSANSNSVAVHCLDLDRFKVVNDTLGHGVGDLLLRKVADRLRTACRKEDHIARVGGDEFIVVQTSVADAKDAERLASRLVDLIGRTYVLSGHTVNIGVSIGVALGEGCVVGRDLLRNGDLALYEAKRAGRGRFRVFEPGMDAALRERRELEIELRRALALKQFEVHYQPFVDLSSDRVIGFEALVRWNHPTRGRISPADFIPLAEETGLINKIGEWVLRTACTTAAGWADDLTVAVNISPVQFKADTLVDSIVSALGQAGLPPHRLEIEITESALLDNTDSVLRTLHALRNLGVQISMDDFGTGYSSLSYLQKFPFHKIKIDRSFVQSAEAGSDSEAILRAIAGLGVSLGMAITAEGVETIEQLERIRSEHCTYVQGYFTGRPVPADRINSFLSP
ncbi:sensor domain-containing protein [Chthonobacter rhizosphaerae]|uniref:sensor domain-containing protein n=1 Tax=Chthonobacter rhizosphaerae TaxID=2735553 RepID=UPI0015EF39A3|nr:bifunctional diguanylate cyclase/phosphodiesterase [Chthonobacter rhizosphaerae]